MGDRTAFQLYLHEVPKGKAKAVAAVFNEYALESDWGEMGTDWGAGDVRVAMMNKPTAVDDQLNAGGSEYIAAALSKLGATFFLWEDPMHEWMGQLYYSHPQLGDFDSECDANGQPLIEAYTINMILKESNSDREVVASLKERLGINYIEAFKELTQEEDNGS